MSKRPFLFTLILLFGSFGAVYSAEKWEKLAEEQGVVVYGREVESEGLIAFRAHTVIKAPPRKVLWVLSTISEHKQWVSNLGVSKLLKRRHAHDLVYYQSFKCPWYIDDRDFVLRGQARRDPRTNAIHVLVNSVKFAGAPETVGVRGELIRNYFVLSPINKGQHTHVRLESLGSPRGWIPNWVVNSVQKDWPIAVLSDIRKQSRKASVKLYPEPPKKASF